MFDCRDKCLLDDALSKFNQLVNSPYLYELTHFPICSSVNPSSCISFIQIKGFPSTQIYKTFSYILNALNSLKTAIGYVLQVHDEQLSIYTGIEGTGYHPSAFKMLQKGLTQTFNGIELYELTPKENACLLETLFKPNHYIAFSAISVIPNADSTPPILSSFNELMGTTEDFVLFLLATPMQTAHLQLILNELIDLSNVLSSFTQGTHSATRGLSKNASTTITRSNTETNSKSATETNTSGSSRNSAQYSNLSSSTAVSLENNKSVGFSLLCNKASGFTSNNGLSCAEGLTRSDASSYSNSQLSATNVTENEAITFSAQNKQVIDAIAHLNLLITRYTNLLRLPTFEFGAYLFAPCISTVARGAYTYLGTAHHTTSTLGPSVVNLWDDADSLCCLLQELQCFKHPYFKLCPSEECLPSTTIINSLEFINTLYFA